MYISKYMYYNLQRQLWIFWYSVISGCLGSQYYAALTLILACLYRLIVVIGKTDLVKRFLQNINKYITL